MNRNDDSDVFEKFICQICNISTILCEETKEALENNYKERLKENTSEELIRAEEDSTGEEASQSGNYYRGLSVEGISEKYDEENYQSEVNDPTGLTAYNSVNIFKANYY